MGLGVWKCSTSTFYFCDSLWQIHFTPDNLNPCYLEPLPVSTPGFTSYNHLLLLPSIARTIDNPNFPLTWSNFCFPSDHLYIIPPLNTWTMFYVCYKLKTKNKNNNNSLLRSETLNLFQNNYINSLSLLFKLSFQFKSSVYHCELIKLLLFNFFFKILLHIFCCSWSEVCLVLAFPAHPFAYFLIIFWLVALNPR